MDNLEVETPGSSQRALRIQLRKILGEISLSELALDFIGTAFFEDSYELIKMLGAGTFGIVAMVKEKSTNNEYAMKVFFL